MVSDKEYRRFVKQLFKDRDKNAISGIYKISCIKNGNFYIGSSSDINKRWIMHKYDLLHCRHVNHRIQKDYDEFGIDFFVFEVIVKVGKNFSRKKLYHVEQQYIDDLSPSYNIQLVVQIPNSPAPKEKKIKILPVGVKGKDINFRSKNKNKKFKVHKEHKPKQEKKKIKFELKRRMKKKPAKHREFLKEQNERFAFVRRQAEINRQKMQNG